MRVGATGGAHLRTMLARVYLEHARKMYHRQQRRTWDNGHSWWTHLLVSDEKPAEFEFCRNDLWEAVEADPAAAQQDQ